MPESEWASHSFTSLKRKEQNALYSENEVLKRDELLAIVKYEPIFA
jgi:hypothetical protein